MDDRWSHFLRRQNVPILEQIYRVVSPESIETALYYAVLWILVLLLLLLLLRMLVVVMMVMLVLMALLLLLLLRLLLKLLRLLGYRLLIRIVVVGRYSCRWGHVL